MQKDIDKYRDAYLEGWDVIRARRLKKMKQQKREYASTANHNPTKH